MFGVCAPEQLANNWGGLAPGNSVLLHARRADAGDLERVDGNPLTRQCRALRVAPIGFSSYYREQHTFDTCGIL
jgi:hypothetical protein